MEQHINSSKEDMLSPLSASGASPGNTPNHNSDSSDPLTQPISQIIHSRPVNPVNPHSLSSSQTFNSNSSGGGGFSVVAVGDGTDSGGLKKKRGRPRKYDAEGNLRMSYASPPSIVSITPPMLLQPPPGFGSSNLQTASFQKVVKSKTQSSGLGFGEMFDVTALGEFTPHVVTVSRGEDVGAKILLLGQQGHKGICVLSAVGVVSNVTIRQPSSSGGILTYEGRFEILSLSGSYTAASGVGGKGWAGALSVSLAGPDGRVVGGGLAGSMTAATPTQLVLGSFIPSGHIRQKRKYVRQQPRPSATPINTSDTVTAAKPISQAMPVQEVFQSQSSGSLELSHDEDEESNEPLPHQSVAPSHSMWSFGPSPDINLSIHGRVTP